MKFDFGAQTVDVWRGAGGDLIGRLIVERLRRFDLRLGGFDAGLIGDGLQIGVADGEHDEIARVFEGVSGGLYTLAGGAGGIDRFPVEQVFGRAGAGVEV